MSLTEDDKNSSHQEKTKQRETLEVPQLSSQFQFHVAFGHSCQAIDTSSTHEAKEGICEQVFSSGHSHSCFALVPFEPLTSQYSLFYKQIGKNVGNSWLS